MAKQPVQLNNRKAMTLMEMVIALAILMVVFAAVLPQFRLVNSSWDARQASAETVQNARVFVDYLNRTLASAVKITDVSSSSDTEGYIEFEDAEGTIYRCDLASNDYIEFGQTGDLSELAGPVSSLKFYCYSLSDMDTPTTTVEDIRYVRVEAVFTNDSNTGRSQTYSAAAFLQANGNVEEAEVPASSMPGIVVNDQIQMGGQTAYVDSYYSLQGAYRSSSAGSNAVVSTNSRSNSDFMLYSGAVIHGDAYVGPEGNVDNVLKLWGGSQVTGIAGVLEEKIDIPGNNFPDRGNFDNSKENESVNLWGNQRLTITEDKYYSSVNINSGTKIIIDGDITMAVEGDFSVGNTGSLELTAGSSLNLYVNGNIGVGGDMNLNGSPNDLRIYMTGNNRSMQMYNDSDVFAVVSNPKGSVQLWNYRPFYGKIMADDYYGNGPVHIDLSAAFDNEEGSSGTTTTVVSP